MQAAAARSSDAQDGPLHMLTPQARARRLVLSRRAVVLGELERVAKGDHAHYHLLARADHLDAVLRVWRELAESATAPRREGRPVAPLDALSAEPHARIEGIAAVLLHHRVGDRPLEVRPNAQRRVDLVESEGEAAAVVRVARIKAGVGLLTARSLVPHAERAGEGPLGCLGFELMLELGDRLFCAAERVVAARNMLRRQLAPLVPAVTQLLLEIAISLQEVEHLHGALERPQVGAHIDISAERLLEDAGSAGVRDRAEHAPHALEEYWLQYQRAVQRTHTQRAQQCQLERNGVRAQRLLHALPLGLGHLSKGEVAEERMHGDFQVGVNRLFHWPHGCGRRLTQCLDLGEQ
eukprot:scaffold7474_cov63-Phaeocystis_antarctica.AAC.9